MKSNITFVIFTKNEEKRIEYPIRCFRNYGEVIIDDDFSTDKTREKAEKLGAKVINRFNIKSRIAENEAEFNYILKFVETDWIFFGFADDMAPKTCLELYKKISEENRYKAVVQKRKSMLYDGKTELHPGLISIKFFRKDALDFSNNTIHQMGKFAPHVKPNEILYLPPIDEYATYHFSTDTTFSLIPKIDRYTSIGASQLRGRVGYFRILLLPVWTFIENYFLHLNCFKGTKGLISSLQFAFGSFVLLAKKYEIDNKITPQSVEENFAEEKERLLISSPHSNIIKKILANIIIFFLSKLHRWYKFRKVC